jgi:hypothetical protein
MKLKDKAQVISLSRRAEAGAEAVLRADNVIRRSISARKAQTPVGCATCFWPKERSTVTDRLRADPGDPKLSLAVLKMRPLLSSFTAVGYKLSFTAKLRVPREASDFAFAQGTTHEKFTN